MDWTTRQRGRSGVHRRMPHRRLQPAATSAREMSNTADGFCRISMAARPVPDNYDRKFVCVGDARAWRRSSLRMRNWRGGDCTDLKHAPQWQPACSLHGASNPQSQPTPSFSSLLLSVLFHYFLHTSLPRPNFSTPSGPFFPLLTAEGQGSALRIWRISNIKISLEWIYNNLRANKKRFYQIQNFANVGDAPPTQSLVEWQPWLRDNGDVLIGLRRRQPGQPELAVELVGRPVSLLDMSNGH